MSDYGALSLGAFSSLLKELVARGQSVKEGKLVEPPMSKADVADLWERLESIFHSNQTSEAKSRIQYPLIETAVRERFNTLVATKSNESSVLLELWDLFDVALVLSEEEQCDSCLLLWLIEELLDSETIAGSRKVLDYMESRRERITAKRSLGKDLVILRSCNELLRRLSRADDTAFCGRVFIFMFQSFPLGDKSSVNLRGEYHAENITTFDPPRQCQDSMEVDVDAPPVEANNDSEHSKNRDPLDSSTKGVTFSNKESPMSSEQLYPIFWFMQNYFNQPTKLFDQASFNSFKSALESTMTVFKTSLSLKSAKAAEEATRHVKRKRNVAADDPTNSFNPKYLTSRDLFDLEIGELSFQRNILVQVLIVVDFLLSLSSKAKEKLAKAIPGTTNKSVTYAEHALSDEDARWLVNTKRTIADYIKRAGDGPFFYRMVETVLSRDKNWSWWKIRSCPSISKPAITPEGFIEAKAAAKKATTNKRLRPNPLGSLDLTFLNESQAHIGLDRLKDPSRYELPSVKSFQDKIDLDDMDIDMATSEEAKNKAQESKASKSWRALRIASTSNLAGFDKIERSDKIDEIFKDKVKAENNIADEEDDEVRLPKDRRPVVISGPSGVGKGTLITMLLEKHPKVFAKKASHTTRKPRSNEVHGTHYYFVSQDEFNILRDGDEFIEFNNYNGNDYGTSQKVVQGIVAQGKVPIMEMDYHGIQQLKHNAYSSRFIFLSPPSMEELEKRLVERGSDSPEKIKERLDIASQELKHSQVEGFHDHILVNDDLDTTFAKLEAYIFGDETDQIEDAVEAAANVTSTAENEPGRHVGTTAMEVVESGKS